jgi:uncharacterized protein YndB with AHSA1/START domain
MTTAHRIGATDFATPSDTEIEATRVVDAPRELVFDCWTKAEHVTKWMLGPEGWTMPVCEIDLRPGGSWHFKWSRADGCEMEMQGTYEEIAPPERLVSTERWDGDWPETVNTVVFTELDGQTLVTSTMRYPSKEARDAALGTGMKDGMDMSFARLDAYLA